MKEIKREKIGSALVAAWRSMGAKYCMIFNVVASCSNLCIDVSTDDDFQIFWDLLENCGEVLRELLVMGNVTRESDFPFSRFPRLLKQSNFRVRLMNQPTNLPVGPIVIGGGDPAAFHARKNLGERKMITTSVSYW